MLYVLYFYKQINNFIYQLPHKNTENINHINEVNRCNENKGTTEMNEHEVKSAETLEWEEAMKRWVNR